MRFENTAAGATAAQARLARAKHFVILDEAEDQGVALKQAQPSLGWAPDIDGHPTLPFSVACRVFLRNLGVPLGPSREAPIFLHFPDVQGLRRMWHATVPHVDLSAEDILTAIELAGNKVANPDDLLEQAGDWSPVQGAVADHGEDLLRWVPIIRRGDLFDSVGGAGAGFKAADLLYFVGPFMMNDMRAAASHFATACKVLGQSFQSDDDPGICDAHQLSTEIADGLADTAPDPLFLYFSAGSDDTADVHLRGGPRVTELRARVNYSRTKNDADNECTRYIVKALPQAMRKTAALPVLSCIFHGEHTGAAIADGLNDINSSLKLALPGRLNARTIREADRALAPLLAHVGKQAFREQPLAERILSVNERIKDTKLTRIDDVSVKASGEPGDVSGPASGKQLVLELTKPDAIFQLERLAAFRASSTFSPAALLEMAHSGRMTPEMRVAALAKAMRLTDPAAKRSSLDAIAEDDKRRPLPTLQQLAWGHIKGVEGYSELQDIYDLGQTIMPDVIAILVARAFSSDNKSVPAALRFARCTRMESALRRKGDWDEKLDMSSDGDAVMLATIEGGDESHVVRLPAGTAYLDLVQVSRSKRIGANILAFFGVLDSDTRSWRQAVATIDHALMSVPASDAPKRARIKRAGRRFLTRLLGDIGRRIDLVRYSNKHDPVGPQYLMPEGAGGAADEFAEAVARVADDQKRRRGEAAEEADGARISVVLPSEAEPGVGATPAPKRSRLETAAVERLVSIQPPGGGDARWAATTAAAAPTHTGKYTDIELAGKPGSAGPPGKVVVPVDAAGASKWLQDHGVSKPCLPFAFGDAGKSTRRWASCPRQGEPGHTIDPSGCHLLPEGWRAQAKTFVKQGSRSDFA